MRSATARRRWRRGRSSPHAPPGGYYVEPHLLRDVPPDSRLGCEEVFGPVLAAMPFADEADAIRIANATDFGLVAGVWTENGARQLRSPARFAAARSSSTTMAPAAASSCRSAASSIPGYGREKGFEALHGFTVLKTVVLQHG